ncbi:hypothetical protein [Emticicia sp. SJ17W-69]|uniref:hypothetical protein n=1 Tax=Emticicia sp. SJ17W-69 TaxID=3421657 RepID=UPI003EB95D23
MKSIYNEILQAIIYSNIFQYPLTKEEIFHRTSLSVVEVEKGLEDLKANGQIFLIENYYCLQNQAQLVENRIKRNKLAEKRLPTARFITRIIALFPFIRGVFLSGSISKNCMYPDSDIDFFIITAPNRLWITRTFCVFFKKIFLFNSENYFCFNYLIDLNHLKINGSNKFLAYEIVTLIPVYGEDICKDFFIKNNWIKDYYPNFPLGKMPMKIVSKAKFQYFFEVILSNKLGNFLDNWLFEKALAINKKRHPETFFQNPEVFINFQRHIAKAHTSNGHQKILETYKETIKSYTETNFAA